MVKTENVIGALPLIASVLGRKYGVKVHIGGERAYTDGRNIHLPALPLHSDENILNLVRGYLDHESAHLRATDFEALRNACMDAFEKEIWNILEDYLVEKRLSELYPGCRQNLEWLVRHIFADRQTDEIQHRAEAIFNWLLFAVRSLSMPELAANRDKWAVLLDADYPALRDTLERLVMAVPAECVDTGSCLRKSHEIMEVLKEYARKESKPCKDWLENNNKGNHENKPQKGSYENSAQCGASACGGASQFSSSDAPDQGQNRRKEESAAISTAAGTAEHLSQGGNEMSLEEYLANPENAPSLDLGQQAGELLQGQSIKNGYELVVAIPVQSTAKNLLPAEITEIRQATSALRNRLQGLLQTTILTRSCIGRSGKIDVGRLARLAVSESKVFVRPGERRGANTAVHVLLDCSYSMRGTKIKLAVQAAYALALALTRIKGVSLAISAFPGGQRYFRDMDSPGWQTVMPLISWHDKLHARFDVPCQGGTPLAEALWWVLQDMQFVRESRKIILIVSDGEPDDAALARDAIHSVQAGGIEIYGIGIETLAMRRLFSEEHSRSVYDLKDLAPAIFDMLQNSLLRKRMERP